MRESIARGFMARKMELRRDWINKFLSSMDWTAHGWFNVADFFDLMDSLLLCLSFFLLTFKLHTLSTFLAFPSWHVVHVHVMVAMTIMELYVVCSRICFSFCFMQACTLYGLALHACCIHVAFIYLLSCLLSICTYMLSCGLSIGLVM